MTRRLVACLLGACGAVLVVHGWNHCTNRASVSKVAVEFLEAVRDGDPYRARQMMVDGERRIPPEIVAGFGWQRDPSSEIRVGHLVVHDDTAIVQTVIERSGYRIQPTLELVRGHDGAWRVSGIGNLTVDRRWVDRFESSSIAEQDRDLTEELRERVKGHLNAPPDEPSPEGN